MFASKKNQIVNRTMTSSKEQIAPFAEIKSFFSKKSFRRFKHKDHVSRNEQLHNTRIAEQTIIFTEIECNNLFAHNALTQRQRSSSDQQSRYH
jgi:hypothetical protein